MGASTIKPEEQQSVSESSTANQQRASLRFRLSFIIILAPLAPAVLLLGCLYYLFNNYLVSEYASATTIVVVLTVVIILVFIITVFVSLFTIRKYVTAPIMNLVERVSKFPAIMALTGFSEDSQSDSGHHPGNELDEIIRSVKNFRTMEGMTKRIRHLEAEVDKIYYDPLTGLYNRRYLDANLERIITTLSRSKSALSVIMVDIDHFKSYNDLYGHLQGDECLKLITAIINESIDRTDDFAVRYGGDEFAVVLPNTDKTGAIHIAETILDNVRAKKIFQDNNPVTDYVSVSIGVTSGKIKHTHIAEDFFERADEMLYKSKQSGRDMYSYSDLV